MANELTVTSAISFTKAGVQIDKASSPQVSVSGTPYQGSVISVSTTEAALPLGNVSTLGYLWLNNIDATNYIEVGVVVSATFYPVVRVNRGESAVFRLAQGITPYVRAHTATSSLEYLLLPD